MYHELTIVGNLGSDPEMRYMPDGTAVTKMSVATNKTWTDKNGAKQTRTTWFRVDVWGAQAENCHKYLAKGRQVMVKGELNSGDDGNPRIWTSQAGEAKASYELRANRVVFLGGKPDNGAPAAAPVDEDDAPF